MTREEFRRFAEHWIDAWNTHDLEAIMSHYDDGVELVSPAARQLLGVPGGRLTGKRELKEYFKRGLQTYPGLRFELKDVLVGARSLVLYFVNQKGSCTAELMELSAKGKVTRVLAHYSL